jgi:hypothetical protein
MSLTQPSTDGFHPINILLSRPLVTIHLALSASLYSLQRCMTNLTGCTSRIKFSSWLSLLRQSPEFFPWNVRNPSQITLQIKLEPMRKLTTKKWQILFNRIKLSFAKFLLDIAKITLSNLFSSASLTYHDNNPQATKHFQNGIVLVPHYANFP